MSTLDARKKYLNSLGKFLEDAARTYQKFMKSLQWTTEYLMDESQSKEMVKCPLNAGHRIPADFIDKHVETCSWIQDGYTKEEKEKTKSSCFFYENSSSVVSVLIDKKTQAEILQEALEKQYSSIFPCGVQKEVPRTMDRAMTELSSADRLAIYEYVVKKGEDTNKARDIQLEDLQLSFERKGPEPKKQKSIQEVIAEERDYKRRRQSYRAKNVHITKKSYTEVMKEVIENQMDMLKHMRETEAGEVVSHQSQSAEEGETASLLPVMPPHKKHESRSHSRSSPVHERDKRRSPSHSERRSRSRQDHHKSKKRHTSHSRTADDESHREKRHKKHRKKHRHHKRKSRRRKSSSSSSSDASSSSHSSSSDDR